MARIELNNSARTYKPNTIAAYIIDSLGYCCLQGFFIRYKDNTVIADRLGVLVKSVRELRKKVAAGEGHCTECGKCLRKMI